MSRTMKAFLILLAGMAAMSLGLIVLLGDPKNPIDLLAGVAEATGFALIVMVYPEGRPPHG
jgi:hypothetical protein